MLGPESLRCMNPLHWDLCPYECWCCHCANSCGGTMQAIPWGIALQAEWFIVAGTAVGTYLHDGPHNHCMVSSVAVGANGMHPG